MTQQQFARFLLFIALGHMMIGVMLFHTVFIDVWQQGWVNVIGPDFLLGSAAAWFMLFAWPLLLIVIQFWNQPRMVNRTFVLAGIIGSIVGVSLMPLSGFWLMLVLNIYALAKRNTVSSAGARC